MTAGPVVGFFDGLTDRHLIGWIANVGAPDRLEPVVCRAANGVERAFVPFMPRNDVCVALGVRGRFGFAIPLHLLYGLGPTISLHNSHGDALSNGAAVDLPTLPAAPPGPRRIVLHIPKTAGTSLRTAMSASAILGDAIYLYPDRYTGLGVSEFAAMPEGQRGAFRLIMGHVAFGLGAGLPGPSEYISFLREPGARLRSNYLHHWSDGTTVTAEGKALDLPTAVTQAAVEGFDNLMVRVIAGLEPKDVPIGAIGEAHVGLALSNIRTSFRFLGIVEQMQAHYPVLRETLALPAEALPLENVTRLPDTEPALRRVDWDEAMRRNRFDVMLYDRVQHDGLAGRDLRKP